MSLSLWFWFAVTAGNLLLGITGLVWWLTNWKWALAFLIGGPCAMVGFACFALLLFFVIDGGVARAVPCEAGCGRLAPVQLRGRRYHRALCDQCERQQARQPVSEGQIIDEGGVRVHMETTEDRRL